jgi:hypothetical protein
MLAGAALAAVALVACGGGSSPSASTPPASGPAGSATATPGTSGGSPSGSAPTQSPVPVESNPPGDIPDTTHYLTYRSSKGHLSVKIPEGWSRTTTSSSASFTDKLNSITATWSKASAAPTPSSARSKDVPMLRRTVSAFTLKHIIDCAPSCTIPYTTGPIVLNLPSTHAVVISYFANSAPNAVTGKQYRDEVERLEFFHNGTEVALTLSGPVGSDNKDPWRLVAESFRWI